MKPAAKFSLEDAQRAAYLWGANCGPGAIAAVLDTTLESIRPFLGEFERKHYTNPSLMYEILGNLRTRWRKVDYPHSPANGLVRVQWEGPWTDPGQPWGARQRHTHWIATRDTDAGVWIFDINCICVGGWVSSFEWNAQVAPWLIRQCEPGAYGTWHETHKIEVLGWEGLP